MIKLLGIEKDKLYINNPINLDTLYFFEITNENELPSLINENTLHTFSQIGKNSKTPNNFLFFIFNIAKDTKTNIKHYKAYIATFSESFQKELSTISTLEKLENKKLLNAFTLSLQYNKEGFFDNKEFYFKHFKIDEKDALLSPFVNTFNKAFLNSIDFNIKVFASIPSYYQIFDFEKALKELNNATLFMIFRFNRLDFVLNEIVSSAKFDKEAFIFFNELKELYQNNKISLVLFNSFLFTYDFKEAYNFFKNASLNFFEVIKLKEKILLNSPFKIFSVNNDFLITTSQAKNYIFTSFYKNKTAEDKDLYIAYKNKDNFYVKFSFKEATAPHTFIVGKTGSGKSVFTQKLLLNLLNINIDKDSFKNLKLNLNYKVRYFDVGLSAYYLFSLFKEIDNENVEIIYASPNNLVFNILENLDTEEDIDTAISIISFAYFIISKEILDADTRAKLKELIISLLEKLKNNKLVVPLSRIKYLKHIYKSAKLLFNINDTENIYKVELHKNFPVLNNITLYNLLTESYQLANSLRLNEDEKKAYFKIYTILKNITQNFPQLALYSNFNISNKSYVYVELSYIKHFKIFPIFMIYLLRRFLKEDVSFSKDYKIYIMEEAHTFFENREAKEDFIQIFSYLAREARKYKIMLIFISQLLSDIPKNIFQNIPNIILVKAKENDELILDAKNTLVLNEKQLNLLKALKKHEAFVFSTSFFSLKWDLNEIESKLFSSEKEINIFNFHFKKEKKNINKEE